MDLFRRIHKEAVVHNLLNENAEVLDVTNPDRLS